MQVEQRVVVPQDRPRFGRDLEPREIHDHRVSEPGQPHRPAGVGQHRKLAELLVIIGGRGFNLEFAVGRGLHDLEALRDDVCFGIVFSFSSLILIVLDLEDMACSLSIMICV